MRRGILVLLIVAVLAAAGVYLYRTRSSPEPATPPATQVVLHQAAKTLLYLPLYIAVDEGFLKQEGIDVRIVTAGGDSQAFAALASGQAQFAQGDPTFVAISHEKGGPGIVIASVLDRVAFWGVTFDRSMSRFTDPKGFKGLTVVTFPRPNTAYVVQEGLLARAGLRLGTDSFITPAAFGTELGPVQAGKAQIATTIEPTVSQALEQGGQIIFSYPDAWGPFLLTGVMTTEDFAEKNPTVIKGMVNAYEKALQLLRTNAEAAVSVGQKELPGGRSISYSHGGIPPDGGKGFPRTRRGQHRVLARRLGTASASRRPQKRAARCARRQTVCASAGGEVGSR